MKTLFSLLTILLLASGSLYGQGGGGAAYSGQNSSEPQSQFATANHSQLVAVSGTAVLSIKPESLRLVFAINANEETSQACAASVKKAINEIRVGAAKIKVSDEDIVEDFIVVEQKFKWELRKIKFKNENEDQDLDDKDNRSSDTDMEKVVQELPDGFRMQTNLHVLCKDERQALDVMDIAFKAGVNDIISFDYWHSDIDSYKKDALKKAIQEAKSKAEILLGVFEKKPKLLNIESSETTSYPESLYKTIERSHSDANSRLPYSWRDYSKIRAIRPMITFYEGSKDYSDLSPKRPSMHPEIAVSSTVTLTYGSPAREESLELEKLKITNQANRDK